MMKSWIYINGNERLKIITNVDGNAKYINVDEKFSYIVMR